MNRTSLQSYRPQQAKSNTRSASTTLETRVVFVLALVIVFMAFIPVFSFPDTISGGVTAGRIYETVLIVAGFGLILLVRTRESLNGREILSYQWPVLGFCVWAAATSVWSLSPILSASKALQLAAIVVGASVAASLYQNLQGKGADFAGMLAIALIVTVCLTLVANTAIWGSPLAMTAQEGFSINNLPTRPRLRSAYGHPGLLGDVASLGIIALVASKLEWRLKLSGLLFLMYIKQLTDTRTATVALVFALAFMFLFEQGQRARWLAVYAGLWLGTGYWYLVLSSATPNDLLAPIRSFLPEDMDTLNGRIPLWEVAREYILASPVTGVGYFASRFVLIPKVPWAGDAHNNWIEILLATGIIGLGLLLAFVGRACVIAIRKRDALLVGTLAYLLLYTFTSIPLFVPELPMVVLMLTLANAYVHSQSASRGHSTP